ncbi:B-cell linker protein isoform X2 [Pseudophryne corroboree]|uniref:B-cell linker protein isoform X2 n=1 Tax=Pseudophryne corroboree TaxID=495146 RepID=UPI0030816476
MASKLPLREEFENWTTSQVADLLKQFGMQECVGVLEKLEINGYTFLNMTDEFNKFNVLYQPQLQKMVHDIKKNEGGLMQKLKNITKQAPPSVPRRDYVPGTGEDEEEWSDEFGSDYESPDEHSDTENYVVPSEDQTDDNYEPPPNPNDNIPSSFKFTDRNGGYADKQVNRQLPSLPSEQINKFTRPLPKPNESFPKPPPKLPQAPNRLHTPNKPVPKPLPKPGVSARPQPTSLPPPMIKKPVSPPEQDCEDEENYIMPEDDNYIEPTQNPPIPPPFKPPTVNRENKPTSRTPAKSQNKHLPEVHEPVVYEVPETESKPSPPVTRLSQPLPRRNSPPKLDPDQEYEVCDDFVSRPEPPSKSIPSPLPRNIKPKPQPKPKTPGLPPKDMNSNTEPPSVLQRKRVPSAGTEPPTVPLPSAHKLPVPVLKSVISVQKPPEVVNRYVVAQSRHDSIVEQGAGVLNKEWYASSFDRKAAEDALQATSKDGSFLVRKSTGQDSNQPFTLAVLYNRRVYNIPVRYIESTQQYALGREKSGEEKFNSVAEIIENHQRNPLVLIDNQNNKKNFTKLKHVVKTS